MLKRDGMLVLRVVRQRGGDVTGRSWPRCVRSQLPTSPTGKAPSAAGTASHNVNERIQLSFGTRYGLRFESAPGQGTTVEILHPLVAAEE